MKVKIVNNKLIFPTQEQLENEDLLIDFKKIKFIEVNEIINNFDEDDEFVNIYIKKKQSPPNQIKQEIINYEIR